MSISEMFEEFIGKLSIKNKDTISTRYGEITSSLNKKFRNTDSKTANTLQVGSFGRKTGIDGISDLDMIYIMPKGKWGDYKDDQSGLLTDVKDAILSRYPRTQVKVDRLVVTVTYSKFYIEVQPVFEQEDGSFKYPDTYNGGSWKITKPKEEMQAISDLDNDKNKNVRRLCKMVRAWRNKQGVVMGGLLIDTLVYNFFNSTNYYDDKSFMYYDELSRDFFKYLYELTEQTEYSVFGSKQRVKVKNKFQKKAKEAYDLCVKAIDANGQKNENNKWKKVFGKSFPSRVEMSLDSLSYQGWNNTEEFIEDRFPVDIRESLEIDCEVTQKGFRPFLLREFIENKLKLKAKKSLLFYVKNISVNEPYTIYWKVLNRGIEAQKRDCVRGQLVVDNGYKKIVEHTSFMGNHLVECYCVKNNVVIARDKIFVPISENEDDNV